MKLKDLIPDGWPEKKKVEDTFYGDCEQADKLGYNECVASLDPIKNAEVSVDRDFLSSECGFTTVQIAAIVVNLDKILVVKK